LLRREFLISASALAGLTACTFRPVHWQGGAKLPPLDINYSGGAGYEKIITSETERAISLYERRDGDIYGLDLTTGIRITSSDEDSAGFDVGRNVFVTINYRLTNPNGDVLREGVERADDSFTTSASALSDRETEEEMVRRLTRECLTRAMTMISVAAQ